MNQRLIKYLTVSFGVAIGVLVTYPSDEAALRTGLPPNELKYETVDAGAGYRLIGAKGIILERPAQ